MSPQHTPGPWALKRHGVIVGGIARKYTNGDAQDQIAMACTVDIGNDGSQEANAKLIAAAPELLAVAIGYQEVRKLQAIYFKSRRGDDLIISKQAEKALDAQAHAAIDKALS